MPIGLGIGCGISRRPNVGGGVPFPSSISSLTARYLGTTGVTTGATFSWADQSGNSHTISQATLANQPTYTKTINGHSVVTFAGSQWLALASALAMSNATAAAVIRTTSTAATPAYAGDAACPIVGDQTNGINFGFGVQSGHVDAKSFTSVTWQDTQGTRTVNDGAAHMLAATISTAGAVATYADNVADGSTSGNSASGMSEWDNIGRGFSASDTFVGDVAEVVIYSRVLTSTELGQLHTYFASFWGVP